MDSYPHELTWADVDPATHPFDAAEVHDVVRTLAPPVPSSPRSDVRPDPGSAWVREQGNPWLAAMSRALEGYYGPWACGWWWSVDDGGPVGAWCCVRHSIGTPAATHALVTGALWEWRRWLEELAAAFAAGDDDGSLTDRVREVTTGSPEWEVHLRQVLAWRKEARGES